MYLSNYSWNLRPLFSASVAVSLFFFLFVKHYLNYFIFVSCFVLVFFYLIKNNAITPIIFTVSFFYLIHVSVYKNIMFDSRWKEKHSGIKQKQKIIKILWLLHYYLCVCIQNATNIISTCIKFHSLKKNEKKKNCLKSQSLLFFDSQFHSYKINVGAKIIFSFFYARYKIYFNRQRWPKT